MAKPATREYAYEVTVPAETTVASPHKEPMTFQPGEVVQVEITVPDGAAALAGIALAMQGTQVMPVKTGQYFVGNGEPILRVTEGYPNSGLWEAVAYNTDIHAHTFQVRFSVAEIAEKPALPGSGTALTVSSTGELVTSGEGSGEGEIGPAGEGETPTTEGTEAIGTETPVQEEAPPEGVTPEPAIEAPEVPEVEPAEEPPVAEFNGPEEGDTGLDEVPEVPGEGELIETDDGEGPVLELGKEKPQPVSAAGRHKPVKHAKKKTVKKAVKRKKTTAKKKTVKKRAATHSKKVTHKKAPVKKAAPKAAPKRAPASRATTHAAPAARRAPAPAPHKAAAKPAPKPKPKPAPKPKPKAPPKPPPPPPKRSPPPPPPKKKKGK